MYGWKKRNHQKPSQKPSSLWFFFVTAIFSIVIALGYVPWGVIASDLLPNVSRKMQEPEFWIKKIQNPSRLLLTPEEIQKMNEETLKKEGFFLCSLSDLKEDWSREEILSLLSEDWKGFGKTEEVRYGRTGDPLNGTFWDGLKNNLNQESLMEVNRMAFGLVVKQTDIRVFPTEEPSINNADQYELDRFQHSSISPGSPLGIYHFSKDRLWAYTQASFIRGWVRTNDLAIAKGKEEVLDYEKAKERLVITGNSVHVFGDLSFQHIVFIAQMGSSFPLLATPEGIGTKQPFYTIRIPFREIDGQLSFRKGYVRSNEDVHWGFLPYHQENVARQAFKMLSHPYGWGDRFGGRDCSRFIMDLFRTFGILMPRNSKFQAQVGIQLEQVEGETLQEKQGVLDHAIPFATLLRLPGHIMLYLGKHKNRHYVIHSTWRIPEGGQLGPRRIGKVVISDLSLGESGPNQSLLHRITDIEVLGKEKFNQNMVSP